MDEEKLYNLFENNKEEEQFKLNIDKYLSYYAKERKFDGRKSTTIKNDLTKIKVFLIFIQDNIGKNLEDLTYTDFVEFFLYLQEDRKVSRNTQVRYFNVIKVFFRINRLDSMDEFIKDSKERKRFKKIEERHYDVCTKDEYNKIIKQILRKTSSTTRFRNALFIKLLWETAARIGELASVKIKDVNLSQNSIRLTNTKGYEERTVIFSDDSKELMISVLDIKKRDKERPLFESNYNNELCKHTIHTAFTEAIEILKKDGFIEESKRIVIHSLRHGRISELLNTFPLDVVKEYAGHKSVKTTMIYAHSKERLESVYTEIKKTL
ncbi:integrase/recombinase XerD [Methanococcus voltae]|uniref:Integrase/recombinase XerD n=1 Tax=Methanococcus voltae TaxID=2188 RepID=A0A8J7RJY0_METVO|nr:tyrosine-type recombinase/integrase [Methanococcus voltae]MBP2202271.1 integrase/recombinase XerD [Methanococcus voltae]